MVRLNSLRKAAFVRVCARALNRPLEQVNGRPGRRARQVNDWLDRPLLSMKTSQQGGQELRAHLLGREIELTPQLPFMHQVGGSAIDEPAPARIACAARPRGPPEIQVRAADYDPFTWRL